MIEGQQACKFSSRTNIIRFESRLPAMSGYYQGNGSDEQPQQPGNSAQLYFNGNGAAQGISPVSSRPQIWKITSFLLLVFRISTLRPQLIPHEPSHSNLTGSQQPTARPQTNQAAAAMETAFPANTMIDPTLLEPSGNDVFSPVGNSGAYGFAESDFAYTPPSASNNAGYTASAYPVATSRATAYPADTTRAAHNLAGYNPAGAYPAAASPVGTYPAAAYPAYATGAGQNIGRYNTDASNTGNHPLYNPGNNIMFTVHGDTTGPSDLPRNPFYNRYNGPDLAARIGLDVINAIANRAINSSNENDDTNHHGDAGSLHDNNGDYNASNSNGYHEPTKHWPPMG